MNELQIFQNKEFGEIRATTIDGEPWFVAADVCRALEHTNPSMALERIDDDEKGVSSIYTLGGTQKMTTVNEPGLYSLVLGSRKPEAKAFKRWITHEVLPSIRKHGAYMTHDKLEEMLADPDTMIKTLQALKEEQNKNKGLTAIIEKHKPQVLFAKAVETAKTSILIGELAKLIKQNGIDIGEKRLFKYLRENGYLIKRAGCDFNMPTQRSMEMKLFEVKETVINHPSGHTTVSKTTKVTGKGQIYFINLFLKEL